MHEQDIVAPGEERLLEWAMAIADGTPVDWLSVASATPSASSEPNEIVVRLQHLERLVRGHEAVRPRAGQEECPALHDTILTEELRKSGSTPDRPLRVHWGPLIVVEKIGRGSFGDVYRAWDPRLDREVALKLIPESATKDAGSPVIEEGRLLARVRHPNVLTVHGAERIDGRVGIWTEYVAGETLAHEIARRGPLSADDAARIGVDVCRALGAVHAAGLLHRDVKAQNILRDSTGRLVLGDFGTGVAFDEHAAVAEPQIAGTPLYLAPEIFQHKPATVASDLYSVGVLLYFLVTGDYPVRGRTFADVKRAHATAEHVPLREARHDLPPAFVDIVEALLSAGPDLRYGTASAVEAALSACLARSADIVQVQQSIAQRLRHDWRAMTAVVAIAILGVALVAAMWRARSAAPGVPAATAWAPLNAGDWIVVASFENQTGEEILDGTIEAAVRRELEYSAFVHVAQRARVADALQSLGRLLDVRLDRQVAQDVSLRDGAVHAFVAGSIAKAGNVYEIVTDVVDPANRTTIATLTDRASQHSDILAAVRRQALRLRGALGEPPSSIDRGRQDLERATLPSLKALHLYAQASTMMEINPGLSMDQQLAVERALRDAVEDDPTFAGAALQLALANIGLGGLLSQAQRVLDRERRADILRYTERAFQLADTATPPERHRIIGHFHHTRTGTPEDPEKVAKAATAWEALAATQPDDNAVMVLLQNCYRVLGRERDAASLDLRLADARPRNAEVNFRVANRLLQEGNLDGARRYALRAESSLSPTASGVYSDGNASVRLFSAYISWLQDNPQETLRALDQVASTTHRMPEAERRQLHLAIWPLYAAIGRLHQAGRVIDAVRRTDQRDVVETFFEDLAKAQFFEENGEMAQLRELAARWRTPIPQNAPFVMGGRAFLLIDAGFLDDAERDLKWSLGLGLNWQATDPSLFNATAALDLARGHREAAAANFRRAIEMALRIQNNRAQANLQQQYASLNLATILEAEGKRSQAISLLEEAGRHRSDLTSLNSLTQWMRGRAQLARLYRKNSQIQEAEAVEAQLLTLLAFADPDYPLLLELRARTTRTTPRAD